MELINENDLQNVCGGSCKDKVSALVTVGTVLVVSGIVTCAVLKGDIKIETVLRPVVRTETIVTERTYYSF